MLFRSEEEEEPPADPIPGVPIYEEPVAAARYRAELARNGGRSTPLISDDESDDEEAERDGNMGKGKAVDCGDLGKSQMRASSARSEDEEEEIAMGLHDLEGEDDTDDDDNTDDDDDDDDDTDDDDDDDDDEEEDDGFGHQVEVIQPNDGGKDTVDTASDQARAAEPQAGPAAVPQKEAYTAERQTDPAAVKRSQPAETGPKSAAVPPRASQEPEPIEAGSPASAAFHWSAQTDFLKSLWSDRPFRFLIQWIKDSQVRKSYYLVREPKIFTFS